RAPHPTDVQELRAERIQPPDRRRQPRRPLLRVHLQSAICNLQFLAYHSTPSIRQFRPEPMPRKPTRSPRSRNSRSSARAAVRGSDTVPMLPREGEGGNSFSALMFSAFRAALWGTSPARGEMALLVVSAAPPGGLRGAV